MNTPRQSVPWQAFSLGQLGRAEAQEGHDCRGAPLAGEIAALDGSPAGVTGQDGAPGETVERGGVDVGFDADVAHRLEA